MDTKDEVILKALLKFTTLCGSFSSKKSSRWFSIYQATLLVLNLFYSIFCMYRIAIIDYPDKNAINIVLDALASFFSVMQGLSFQIACLCFSKPWRNLYDNLTIDCHRNKFGKIGIFLEIFTVQMIFIARLILAAWIWCPIIGCYKFMDYGFRHVNDYITMVSVLLIVHINIAIKKKYFLINLCLLRSNYIGNIPIIHRNVTKLIKNFNVVFGYQILFIFAHTIVVMLESLQNILWYIDFNNANSFKVLLWEIVYSFLLIV